MGAEPKGLRLAWQVWRAEGGEAVRDRLLDRLAARRRRRGYRRLARLGAGDLERTERLGGPPAAVLNVLPTPPRPDLGGVQVQLLRRLEAEAGMRPWALLYPAAGGYRLETRDGGRRRAVVYEVPAGLGRERLHDPTFARVVRHAARSVGADTIHVEQPVGLPLASLAEIEGSGLKRVLSLHDFGLFCLRPHLVERPRLRFCGYCREPERCARCLARDWRLEPGFQERRREVAGALLRAADAVVYASDFLRHTYRELVSGLDPARQHVIEPPSVSAPVRVPPLAPRPRIRHLAYVGSVQAHKGALVLEALIRRLGDGRYPDLRWSVYGGGDRQILGRLRRLPAVRIRGYYRAGALPRRLRDDGVDLALLLSIWPESYALTLDECLLAGVPAAAFDHGALGERLRALRSGVLLGADVAVEPALERLREVLDEGWRPAPAGRPFEPPAAEDAARAYLEIYRGLTGSRLSV